MKHLIAILTICCFLNANAQFNSESFKVTLSDLETNIYEKDSTSNALVIYEEGYSYIDNKTYKLITEVKRKIKIFNKNSNDHINVELPIRISKKNKKESKIKDIKGVTYNYENNLIKKTPLKQRDIFTEKYNEHRSYLKFSLPNVQDGAVITYSYTIESPFIYNYQPWYFQDNIPTLYSKYVASIPGIYEYHIKLVGYKGLDVENSSLEPKCIQSYGAYANCVVSTYIMKDMPAIKEEDYITTLNNYISRVEYELKTVNNFDGSIDKVTKTWKDTDKELKIEDLGKQILRSSNGKNVIPETIANINEPLEKAKAIYEYIQKNYTWNDEFGLYGDLSVKNLLKKKSGKAPEINILLHNVLEANNIESKAVLISTRANGFATKLYPQMSDFNYLIVEATINDKTYLLDATSKYTAFDQLPFRCLNQYGRKLDFKKGSSWVDIKPKHISAIQQKYKLTLDADEELITGEVTNKYMGYHSISKKKRYFSNATAYKEQLANKLEDLNISDINVTCDGFNDNQFTESFDIEFEDLNIVDDKIYIDPFLIKFFRKNPFQLQERTYPVDFGYKDSFAASIQIDLGDEYTAESYPENINLRLPENGGSLLLTSNILNNKLNIFIKINFKKALYSPYEYASLKAFMDKVVNTQTKSLIILSKN